MTSFRSSALGTNSTGTAISVALPAGAADGDVINVIVHVNANTTVVDNNGARAFLEDLNDFFDPSGSQVGAVFSRRLVSGDAAALAGTGLLFTGGSSTRWSAVATAFQSPHATDIYDVLPTAVFNPTPGDSSAPSPTITTLTASAIHCAVCCPDGSLNTFNATPAGYTVDQQTGNQAIGFAHKVIASPGATGAQAWSLVDSPSPSIGISFAIKDSSAVTASPRRAGMSGGMRDMRGGMR